MSKNKIGKVSKKRLTEIKAITIIDTSDIPEATEDFFKRAKLKLFRVVDHDNDEPEDADREID